MTDKWEQRLIGIGIGLGIAVLLTAICYAGSVFGWWDALWAWSGLWRYVPQAEVEAQVVEPELANPSFEGDYAVQDNKTTIIVAPHWRGFWKDGGNLPDWAQQGASSGPIRQPEYKAATLAVDARRVRSGSSAQCFFTFYGVMLGGVQQTVAAQAGSWHQAGFQVQAWTDGSDDPCKTTGQMVATVGIDPLGGADPWARRVVWADWQDANPGCGKWNEIKSPVVQAQGAQVTVFLLAQHRWSLKHGDLYIEDAWLHQVSMSGDCPDCPVCPEPTPCPVCPDCPAGGTVDYARIEQIVIDAIDGTRLVR